MNSLARRDFYKPIPSPREQTAHMKLVCPGFDYRFEKGTLIGVGDIIPSASSRRYRFQIRYGVTKSPSVTILDPPLKTREDQTKIPHTYGPNEPCLFRPWVDWSSDKLLAYTVFPWLGMWLVYYELWLATGTWFGGGEHPVIEDAASPPEENIGDEYVQDSQP